jgi:hypothetical protein
VKKFGLVGWLLVVVGVMGEGIFEGLQYFTERQSQTLNDILLADAQERAGEANERAAKADEKRVALENRIADIFGPRQLTPEQESRIAAKLTGLKGVQVDVEVLAVGNPYTAGDAEDSLKIGHSVVRILSSAPTSMDAEGWLLDDCQDSAASNLVVIVRPDLAGKKLQAEDEIGLKIIKAFAPEIGTDPRVEKWPPTCFKFSYLDRSKPNERPQGATAISIVIGRKVNPLLTREMLEPSEKPKR